MLPALIALATTAPSGVGAAVVETSSGVRVEFLGIANLGAPDHGGGRTARRRRSRSPAHSANQSVTR
jgi:hypothetical protein